MNCIHSCSHSWRHDNVRMCISTRWNRVLVHLPTAPVRLCDWKSRHDDVLLLIEAITPAVCGDDGDGEIRPPYRGAECLGGFKVAYFAKAQENILFPRGVYFRYSVRKHLPCGANCRSLNLIICPMLGSPGRKPLAVPGSDYKRENERTCEHHPIFFITGAGGLL